MLLFHFGGLEGKEGIGCRWCSNHRSKFPLVVFVPSPSVFKFISDLDESARTLPLWFTMPRGHLSEQCAVVTTMSTQPTPYGTRVDDWVPSRGEVNRTERSSRRPEKIMGTEISFPPIAHAYMYAVLSAHGYMRFPISLRYLILLEIRDSVFIKTIKIHPHLAYPLLMPRKKIGASNISAGS
jgi:hypothetical protein